MVCKKFNRITNDKKIIELRRDAKWLAYKEKILAPKFYKIKVDRDETMEISNNKLYLSNDFGGVNVFSIFEGVNFIYELFNKDFNTNFYNFQDINWITSIAISKEGIVYCSYRQDEIVTWYNKDFNGKSNKVNKYGEIIKLEDDAYWTQEFDAYISERGYQMIQNAYSTGELSNNPEWELIFGEWYWKDEAESAMSDDFYDEGGEG